MPLQIHSTRWFINCMCMDEFLKVHKLPVRIVSFCDLFWYKNLTLVLIHSCTSGKPPSGALSSNFSDCLNIFAFNYIDRNSTIKIDRDKYKMIQVNNTHTRLLSGQEMIKLQYWINTKKVLQYLQQSDETVEGLKEPAS